MRFDKIFLKPDILAVIADINEGKSMLLYHILEELSISNKFKLYAYGLRLKFKNCIEIHSVAEMEQIRDSLIFIDELSSLFDLDNRKIKRQIENTLRLLFHNNNIVVLCGTPENFKKFISGKIKRVFYKKITLADFINGSRVKNILMNYKGNERGSEMLNLKINECLFYDGKHYSLFNVPYYEKYDSKKDNNRIIVPKNQLKKRPSKRGIRVRNKVQKKKSVRKCKLCPQ